MPRRQFANRSFVQRPSVLSKQETYHLKQGEELKVICNPLLAAENDPPPRTINYKDAYDVFHLGAFNAGEATVRMGIYPNRNEYRLQLHVDWTSAAPDGPALTGYVTLPLRFDRSSSCVLVTDDFAKRESSLPAEAWSTTPDVPVHGRNLDATTMSPDSQALGSGAINGNGSAEVVSADTDTSDDPGSPVSSSDEDDDSEDSDFDVSRIVCRTRGGTRGGRGRGRGRGRGLRPASRESSRERSKDRSTREGTRGKQRGSPRGRRRGGPRGGRTTT